MLSTSDFWQLILNEGKLVCKEAEVSRWFVVVCTCNGSSVSALYKRQLADNKSSVDPVKGPC